MGEGGGGGTGEGEGEGEGPKKRERRVHKKAIPGLLLERDKHPPVATTSEGRRVHVTGAKGAAARSISPFPCVIFSPAPTEKPRRRSGPVDGSGSKAEICVLIQATQNAVYR